MKRNFIKVSAVLLVGAAVYATAACAKEEALDTNLIHKDQGVEKVVNLFTPVEKSNPNAGNVARTAQEISIMEAEEKLNLRVEYRSYTAEDYKEKTYDDVALDRVRSNMDDVYLLNPDTIQVLGAEGQLADLSGLDNVKNLREVVKAANMVNGKLVAIPQEVVSYGLFVNQDMFDDYDLELPQTPDDLLECCRVFKENGIETPIGANRWWLENFVLAQAYADLYNGDTADEEIAALNSGEAKYSDYMRAGFEYLQELIDLEYIDAETAYTYEAIEGEGPDFLAQKTPIVMAYWAAANADTAYGDVDFNLQVIGFPTKLGQMPVVSMNGYGVGVKAEHLEDAMDMMNVLMSDQTLQTYADTNQVISPSKNVEVDCRDALKPLNAKINEGVYVLGSNANMKLEQWGNTCVIVRSLLKGASVDDCMEAFDELQAETLQ